MASKKLFFACVTAAICLFSPVSALAEDAAMQNTASASENTGTAKDAYLITDHRLNCYNDSSKVYITSTTIGSDVMAEIGIIDIQVQRSANGVSGWTTCVSEFDLIESNASACHIYDYGVSVTSGYYYRVVVTHYAKETGWFFPKSQSVNQTSGVMRMM